MYGYRLQISNQNSSDDRVDKSEHKMYTVRHMSVMGASDYIASSTDFVEKISTWKITPSTGRSEILG